MKSRNFLLILLIAAFLAPASLVYAANNEDEAIPHFRLAANAGWVDSGYVVTAGQELTITAYGQAITARINEFDKNSVSGPNGQAAICPNYEGAPACAMDNAPYGALVAKIGPDGTPFLVGAEYGFTPETTGSLYLAVNDLLPYYADNNGNFMVFFNP